MREFTFKVYSRRYKSHDSYRIKRTERGWHVSHIMINGDCDKTCAPILYRNFKQDSIEYPAMLGEWFEVLWDRAARNRLTEDQIQSGLDDLANWVNVTEKSVPSGGIWKGWTFEA